MAKTALITGSARGIGAAIALRLASDGFNIAFNDIGFTAFENNEVVEQVKAKGVETEIFPADVSSHSDCEKLVKDVKNRFGTIDVLVNNAGITKDGLLLRMTEQQWDAVINVNLKSVFNFTKAVAPIMSSQRSGSIINMSSVVGVSGNAGQVNYSASKAGIIGLTKSVAKEFGKRGIRSNAIAPGFIITDMTAQLSEEVRKDWESKIPLHRGGTPQDVANVCLFLASDLSSYVSGQVLHVCGGMNM